MPITVEVSGGGSALQTALDNNPNADVFTIVDTSPTIYTPIICNFDKEITIEGNNKLIIDGENYVSPESIYLPSYVAGTEYTWHNQTNNSDCRLIHNVNETHFINVDNAILRNARISNAYVKGEQHEGFTRPDEIYRGLLYGGLVNSRARFTGCEITGIISTGGCGFMGYNYVSFDSCYIHDNHFVGTFTWWFKNGANAARDVFFVMTVCAIDNTLVTNNSFTLMGHDPRKPFCLRGKNSTIVGNTYIEQGSTAFNKRIGVDGSTISYHNSQFSGDVCNNIFELGVYYGNKYYPNAPNAATIANNVSLGEFFDSGDAHSFNLINNQTLTLEEIKFTSDYHLDKDSPCVGAGNVHFLPGDRDLSGKLWKTPPSIGCYECYRGRNGVPGGLFPLG